MPAAIAAVTADGKEGEALTGSEVATAHPTGDGPLAYRRIERMATTLARTLTPRFAGAWLLLWLAIGLGAALTMSGRVDLNLNPDVERNLFALVSALALAAASVLFGLAVVTRRVPQSAIALAALLAFMSFDEAFVVHERLERWVGWDWTTLYAPFVALGAVAGLHVIRVLGRGWASTVLLLGGASWGLAYLLEKVQWDGADNAHRLYTQMMFTEEMLELGGSMLLSIAVLLILPRDTDDRLPQSERPLSDAGWGDRQVVTGSG